ALDRDPERRRAPTRIRAAVFFPNRTRGHARTRRGGRGGPGFCKAQCLKADEDRHHAAILLPLPGVLPPHRLGGPVPDLRLRAVSTAGPGPSCTPAGCEFMVDPAAGATAKGYPHIGPEVFRRRARCLGRQGRGVALVA